MRFRLTAVAAALALGGISFGVWRGLAIQGPTIDQPDCSIRAALPPCAAEPHFGIPVHDLIVTEPELASARAAYGTLAVIRFAPKAAAADITEFLVANSISVVDGPKGGEMFTVRLPETGKKKADLIKRIAIETAIVDFIATVR
jgi:hypothetical protein